MSLKYEPSSEPIHISTKCETPRTGVSIRAVRGSDLRTRPRPPLPRTLSSEFGQNKTFMARFWP